VYISIPMYGWFTDLRMIDTARPLDVAAGCSRLFNFPAPEDHSRTDQTNRRPDPVVPIGSFVVDTPSPEEGHYDKHSAVSGVHSTERRKGLKGGNHAVQRQNYSSQQPVHAGTPLPQPQPDQITSANFGQSCENEQRHCLDQIRNPFPQKFRDIKQCRTAFRHRLSCSAHIPFSLLWLQPSAKGGLDSAVDNPSLSRAAAEIASQNLTWIQYW